MDDISVSNKITEAVIQWGKGSGKDWITSLLFCRHVYLLLNLNSPQKYFNKPESTHIDLMNVAYNAKQAKRVFFKYLTNLVKNAGYRAFMQFGLDPKNDILDNEIRFPKNITCYSGNSEQEGIEGFNLYLAVMDEASAFKAELELKKNKERHKHSAYAIYSVLRKSITSRFPKRGKLVLISYPRYKHDFIQTMYNKGLKLDHVYTSFGATWEVNPTLTRDDLANEYVSDPDKARAMYECIPPAALDPFFTRPELIDQIAENSLIVDPFEGEGLKDSFVPLPGVRYVIGCDLSLTGDATGIAMGHVDRFENNKPFIHIDLVKPFYPKPNRQIDLEEVRQLIFLLRNKGFHIGHVYYDQFQSADTIQILQRNGFQASLYSVDRNMEGYLILKSLLYEGRIDFYYHPILVQELKGLRLVNGKKVDHPEPGSKDLADAVARVCANLTKEFHIENQIYHTANYSSQRSVHKRATRSLFGRR